MCCASLHARVLYRFRQGYGDPGQKTEARKTLSCLSIWPYARLHMHAHVCTHDHTHVVRFVAARRLKRVIRGFILLCRLLGQLAPLFPQLRRLLVEGIARRRERSYSNVQEKAEHAGHVFHLPKQRGGRCGGTASAIEVV